MNRYGRMIVQIGVIIVIYYLLDYFNLLTWYTVLALFVVAIGYVYMQARIKDNELYLEIMCNTAMYLRRLESSKGAKLQNESYFLGLAYAALYKNELEEAEANLAKVTYETLPNPERQHAIYIRIAAKLAYNNQNKAELAELKKEAEQEDYTKLVGYITVLDLMLDKKYDEMVTTIKELVPKELIRLHVVELEYLLAECYLEQERYDDANTVLSFVVRRGYGIAITDVAYEKYIELQDSGLLAEKVEEVVEQNQESEEESEPTE